MRVGEGEGRALAVDIVFAGLCQLEDRKLHQGSCPQMYVGLGSPGLLLPDRSLEPQLRADSRFLKSQRAGLLQGG